MQCPRCNWQNPASNTLCFSCQTPLPVKTAAATPAPTQAHAKRAAPAQDAPVFPSIWVRLGATVIDGLFISTCVGGSLEFWRIAKNVQNWSLGPINGWAILVNPESWQKLPADVQKQVQGAMDAVQQDAFGKYDEFVANSRQAMEKNGVTFWVAPDEERAKLMQPQYIGPAYDAWNKRAKQVGFDGPAYLDRVRKVLGKTEAQ